MRLPRHGSKVYLLQKEAVFGVLVPKWSDCYHQCHWETALKVSSEDKGKAEEEA